MTGARLRFGHGWSVVPVVALGALLFTLAPAHGQGVPGDSGRSEAWSRLRSSPGIRWREDLDPSNIPAGWTQVDPLDLETFLLQHGSSGGSTDQENISSDPPLAVAESAVYEATFDDEGLLQGTCEFRLTHRGNGSVYLNWSAANISLHNLQHDGQQAIWGTSQTGERLVMVAESGVWKGLWSRASSPSLDLAAVDLELPEVLNTRLILRLPAHRRLVSSTGLVTGPTEDPGNPNVRLWSVDLGRQSRVRLAQVDLDEDQPGLLPAGNVDVVYSARLDGLTLLADVSLAQLRANTRELQFQIAPQLQILSVSAAGNPLPFEHGLHQPNVLSVMIDPASLTAGRLNLRIRAFQAVPWNNRLHELPRIELLNAQELDRKVRLFVEAPLGASRVEFQGLHQVGLQSDELGETWSFIEMRAASVLSLAAQRPVARVGLSSRTVVDLAGELPVAVGEVVLRGLDGSAFEVSLDWPTGWDIVQAEGLDARSRLSTWELETGVGGTRTLKLEFRQPLLSGASHTLKIKQRGRMLSPHAGLPLPIPLLKTEGPCDVHCWVINPGEILSASVPDTRFQSEPVTDWPIDLSPAPASLENPIENAVECWVWSGSGTAVRPELRISAPATSPPGEVPLETSIGSATKAAVRPDADSLPMAEVPPAAILRLATTIAASRVGKHVHRAVYTFPQPVTPATLRLQLDPAASLSMALTDAGSVTLLRSGADLQFPANTADTRRLELVYVTPAPGGWLRREATIPLPQLSARVVQFEWHPEIPRPWHFFRCELGSAMVSGVIPVSWGERLFGPVARTAQQHPFRPWRWDDWSSLFVPEMWQPPGQQSIHELHVRSPTVPASIHFSIWNRDITQAQSWVSLLGCLLMGTAFRRHRWQRLPIWSMGWIALLLTACLFLDEPTGIICGGGLLGTVLSLLMPRRLVRARDWLAAWRNRSPEASSHTDRRSQAGSMLVGSMVCGLAASIFGLWKPTLAKLSEPIEAAQVQTADGSRLYVLSTLAAQVAEIVDRSTPVSFLIRTANYQVVPAPPGITVLATYQVLIPANARTQFLELTLGNAIFRDDYSGSVNGTPVRIIPGLAGQTVVLQLPDQAIASPEVQTNPGWHEMRVELRFAIRAGSDNTTTPHIEARIPPVSDATLISENSLLEWRRLGTRSPDIPHAVRLGPLAQLSSQNSVPRELSGRARVMLLLDATPRSIRGSMQLQVNRHEAEGPGDRAQAAQLLRIQLPPKCVIDGVSGQEVEQWQVQTDPSGTAVLVLWVGPEKDATWTNIVVQYELPLSPESIVDTSTNPPEQVYTSPEFTMENLMLESQALALSIPASWRLQVIPWSSLVEEALDAEDWRKVSSQPTSRLAWAGRYVPASGQSSNTTVPLRWRLSPPADDWTWRATQLMDLDADALQWRVTLDSGPLFNRTFVETLRVPIAMSVESVSAVQAGRQRPIRWSRRGEVLTLFISDELAGQLVVTLRGSMPLAAETWASIGRLTGINRAITQEQMSLSDRTFWNVDLEDASGGVTTFPHAPKSNDDVRVLRTLTDARPLPTRLRLLPAPDAASAQILTILEQRSGNWVLNTHLQVTAVQGTLRHVLIDIPPHRTLLQWQPFRLERTLEERPDGWQRLRITVPPRSGSMFHCSLVTAMAENLNEAESLAGLSLPSAVIDRQWWQIPENISERLEAAAKSSAPLESLPEWARAKLRLPSTGNSRPVIESRTAEIPLISAASLSGPTRIALADTLIWGSDQGICAGETTWWVVAGRSEKLSIVVPEGVQLNKVFIDGKPLDSSQAASDEMELRLDRTVEVAPVTMFWQQAASSRVQWPHALNVSADRELASVAVTGVVEQAGVRRITSQQSDLLRLEQWLECLSAARHGIPVDSPVLSNVRAIIDKLSSQRSLSPSDRSHALNEPLDRLLVRWREIQSRILVTADGPNPQSVEFARNLSLRPWQPEAPQVLLIDSQVRQVQLNPQQAEQNTAQEMVIRGASALMGMMFVLLLHFIGTREHFAKAPGLAWSTLGLIWWALLSPSVLGCLLIVIGVVMEALRLLKSRSIPAPGPSLFEATTSHG